MDLHCRTTTIGATPTLHVSGELDLATVAVLRDALLKVVSGHPGSVVAVDLDGVTALDDTALGIMMGGAARAREHGGDLVLVCSSDRLRRRFELTGLARAIEVRERLTP